jgi:hypothetical protein
VYSEPGRSRRLKVGSTVRVLLKPGTSYYFPNTRATME